MHTRVVFRDTPALPPSLRDPQPRLRGWQWLSFGAAIGVSFGFVLGQWSALTPDARHLNRLMREAHELRIARDLRELRENER